MIHSPRAEAPKLLYIEDTNQQTELENEGSTRINRESKEGKTMMDEVSKQLVGQDPAENLGGLRGRRRAGRSFFSGVTSQMTTRLPD